MLKRLYEKSRLGFALAWIVAYCVLLSMGDALSREWPARPKKEKPCADAHGFFF